MKIKSGWKVLGFFVLLIVAIISAGGWDYIKSNIPTEEEPYQTINRIDYSTDNNATDNNEGKETENLSTNNNETQIDKIISDDWQYKDKDIDIKLEMVMENDVTFYVADIKISDPQYLKKAFANDAFGNGNRDQTSDIAKAHNAILAINGDYYTARDHGIIVKDGVVYRNEPYQEMMGIFRDGSMKVFDEKTVNLDELMSQGLYNTLSFGPALVIDGEAVEDFSWVKIKVKNPRTGIGMIDPLHYIFITVDGRVEGYSVGMTMNEFADEFEKRGCEYAYNLDGGGTATMYFNGRVVNRPCDIGGERKVSDIMYIGR